MSSQKMPSLGVTSRSKWRHELELINCGPSAKGLATDALNWARIAKFLT